MRILVSGATGMLGTAVVDKLSSGGFELTCLARRAPVVGEHESIRWLSIDLNEPLQIKRLINPLKFDAVVHCAAITNLVFCEEHPEEAYRVHVQATETLAKLFSNARFLYISTDSVFDGRDGNYKECEVPAPLNIYSETKLGGESSVQNHSKGLVIRTNMYDIRPFGGTSLAEWAYNSWTSGEEINGFTNVMFNPLHVSQLAELISLLLTTHESVRGVLHAGCDTHLSKHEFLARMCRVTNLPEAVVHPTEYQASQNCLARPLNTSLCIARAREIFGSENFCLESGLKALAIKVASFGNDNAIH